MFCSIYQQMSEMILRLPSWRWQREEERTRCNQNFRENSRVRRAKGCAESVRLVGRPPKCTGRWRVKSPYRPALRFSNLQSSRPLSSPFACWIMARGHSKGEEDEGWLSRPSECVGHHPSATATQRGLWRERAPDCTGPTEPCRHMTRTRRVDG